MENKTFTASIRDYAITVRAMAAVLSTDLSTGQPRELEPAQNIVRWDGMLDVHPISESEALPTCFGKVVGITTRPRPDHDMLIFFERAVYAMHFDGPPSMFVFTPLICE